MTDISTASMPLDTDFVSEIFVYSMIKTQKRPKEYGYKLVSTTGTDPHKPCSRWGSRGYMPLAVGSHFLGSNGVKAILQVSLMSSVYFMHYTFPSSVGLRTEVETSFQGVETKPSSFPD